MNTSEFLSIAASIVPDRLAMIYEGRRITYEEMQKRVIRLANALANRGIGAGDRVAILQVNCNEHIETTLATAKLDAVYVPLNFRVGRDELIYMVSDSLPKVLMVGQRYVELVRSCADKLHSVQQFVVLEGPEEGWISYDDLINGSSEEERVPQKGDQDLAIIIYTSGTTGMPKGVMLSHDSFSSYLISSVDPADPEIEERNILTVPMYHIAGVQAVMSAIFGGRTLIIQRQFEPKQWMVLVEQERINRAMMVPTMLKALMDHPDFPKHDLSSLEVITYGAAPMPREVVERAIRQFPNTRFINAFGQTETAATITMLPPEDHLLEGSGEDVEKKLRRLSSIGKPLEDVEVCIVDEEGAPVALGVIGEIVARGARMMTGYWNKAEATAETVRDGWVYTGDLGYFDEDGYIFLAGRAKDFIKRGGEMVSPEEVEQVLRSHPAVEDAAIIGVPDVDWGERVNAVIVLKKNGLASKGEIIEHCRQRLASFKKPEDVVFVRELPRNTMGKVLKGVLRKHYGHPPIP